MPLQPAAETFLVPLPHFRVDTADVTFRLGLSKLADLLFDNQIFLALEFYRGGKIDSATRAMASIQLHVAAARTLLMGCGDVLQGFIRVLFVRHDY